LAADSGGSSFWTCSATASSVRASFTPTSGSASARQLHQWLEEAGFGKLEVTVVSREKESPHFQTVFATGSK